MNHFRLRDVQYPEDTQFLQLKNIPISQLFDWFDEFGGSEEDTAAFVPRYLFDGFLEVLRDKGIPVSVPEWLHFMKIVQIKAQQVQLLTVGVFFEILSIYAQTTLIKDKRYYALFYEAFDEYFLWMKKLFEAEINMAEKQTQDLIINSTEKKLYQTVMQLSSPPADVVPYDGIPKEELEEHVSSSSETVETSSSKEIETLPQEIKNALGIKEVNTNLQVFDDPHPDTDQQHGGKDQHNDLLQKIDKSKMGGGDLKNLSQHPFCPKDKNPLNQKENHQDRQKSSPQLSQQTKDAIGGGDLKWTTSVNGQLTDWTVLTHPKKRETQKQQANKYDCRNKYERRPDKSSMREVVNALRKIVLMTSGAKLRKLAIPQSVKNLAKKNYTFEYTHEKQQQQEIVLFIDVGGPVDEWRPIIDEVTSSMTKGISKLEVYCFHNNLYGYVWKYDTSHPSNVAPPNSLLNIKSIVKQRKRVIIYGDAEMARRELQYDNYEPKNNQERVVSFGMDGLDCLDYIKKMSKSVVWLNPIFQKERTNRSRTSTSLSIIQEEIPMYDLTVGGIEDAVKFLMKKK